MRILICGGRDFNREDVFDRVLNSIKSVNGDLEIISGMARGADTMAVNFAKTHGYKLYEFPADWSKYNNAAGPIRNQQMIDEGNPDIVIAFPTKNSRGTWDMIRRAEKANIKIIIVNEEY